MHIIFVVAIAMMFTVMTGPPQRTFLHTHHSANRQEQLERSARAVGAMCEIPVIARGDEPDPAPHHEKKENESNRCDAKHDRSDESDNVESKERNRTHPIHLLVGGAFKCRSSGARRGVTGVVHTGPFWGECEREP